MLWTIVLAIVIAWFLIVYAIPFVASMLALVLLGGEGPAKAKSRWLGGEGPAKAKSRWWGRIPHMGADGNPVGWPAKKI